MYIALRGIAFCLTLETLKLIHAGGFKGSSFGYIITYLCALQAAFSNDKNSVETTKVGQLLVIFLVLVLLHIV